MLMEKGIEFVPVAVMVVRIRIVLGTTEGAYFRTPVMNICFCSFLGEWIKRLNSLLIARLKSASLILQCNCGIELQSWLIFTGISFFFDPK
uniref:Uncharacterized protein n=1 Tax=Arundo donax TaxID=35708 RepID=A0A0A9BFQ1_ARUDO